MRSRFEGRCWGEPGSKPCRASVQSPLEMEAELRSQVHSTNLLENPRLHARGKAPLWDLSEITLTAARRAGRRLNFCTSRAGLRPASVKPKPLHRGLQQSVCRHRDSPSVPSPSAVFHLLLLSLCDCLKVLFRGVFFFWLWVGFFFNKSLKKLL